MADSGRIGASSAAPEHTRIAGRRRFLHGALTAAAGFLAPTTIINPASAGSDALVTIAYDDSGVPIASDFIGLSYESAALADGDYFSAENTSVLSLIRLLGSEGVVRIGGNTSERTVWNADPGTTSGLAITPSRIDRLAAFMRATGWKLIYGLNLARGAPEQAAAEAAYVSRALGSSLLAFQIGNEPDGFGRWTAVRPKAYDADAFMAEWSAFHAAILAQVPHARFAGPDVAAETDWVDTLAAARPANLVLLTRHYYADGPAGAPHVSLARLLRAGGQALPVLKKLREYSSNHALPYRITEANSVYNEGQPGVSDTLGAALWGLEFMFEVAAAAAAGINFHAGIHNLRPDRDKAYTPIARSAGGSYCAAPLFYGMLMFAQLCRGAVVPVVHAPVNGQLNAFAVRSADGGLQVCLINKHEERSLRVDIDLGRNFAAGSIMRLRGPAAAATGGVTLGESSIADDGAWSPTTTPVLYSADRKIAVDVLPASATLISMGG